MSATIDDLQAQLAELTAVVRVLAQRIPALVSIGQAAQALDVSERTVRRWVRERRLHATKVGNVVRIDLASFTR